MSNVIYSKDMSPLRLATIISMAKGKNVGSKKSTPCYIVDDYVVLHTSIKCSDYQAQDTVINEVNALANSGTNVVKIYGYISDESTKKEYRFGSYCKCFMVMDKATGVELYKRDRTTPESNVVGTISFMKTLAKAPQEHFDKFVKDYMSILSRGVAVDPSKKENFFYDSEKGFTFIDVRDPSEDGCRFAVAHMLSVLCPPYVSAEVLCQNPDLEKQFDLLSAEILVKTDNALLNCGFTRADIDECFMDRSYADGIYASAMEFGNIVSVNQAKDIIIEDSIM